MYVDHEEVISFMIIVIINHNILLFQFLSRGGDVDAVIMSTISLVNAVDMVSPLYYYHSSSHHC